MFGTLYPVAILHRSVRIRVYDCVGPLADGCIDSGLLGMVYAVFGLCQAVVIWSRIAMCGHPRRWNSFRFGHPRWSMGVLIGEGIATRVFDDTVEDLPTITWRKLEKYYVQRQHGAEHITTTVELFSKSCVMGCMMDYAGYHALNVN